MSSTFKNAAASLDNVGVTIYTCPALTQAVLHGFYISNKNATTNRTVVIEVYDSSAIAFRNLGKNILLPFEDTFVFDGKINLEAGDYLKLTVDAGTDCEAFLSVLEVL